VLIQGSTGGMATALIQLGRAAGFEVWTTSRTDEGQAQARALGAHASFPSNEPLPRKVRAVIDNIGASSWSHSMASLDRGGTLVTTGGTTGFEVPLNLLPMIAAQLTVAGSIMGNIGKFLEDLARPLVLPESLATAYAEMAADEAREAEADEWCEPLIGDGLDATR
jgi:NADPH:quinone reductase-like Zn-dependent oxidoreductase